MPSRFAVAALALLLACPVRASDLNRRSDVPINSAPLTLRDQAASEPPSTRLLLGDTAPNFSYLGPDGAWHRSSELTQGPVLLVFGASASELKALEEARAEFLDLGVKPVAVVDMRTGQAAKLSRKLNLSCPIVCDPLRAIADLYNSLDPFSLRHAPSYFVLDDHHVIRALSRGQLPSPSYLLGESARVLGKPLPEAARSETSS